jgi:hypothetical protein
MKFGVSGITTKENLIDFAFKADLIINSVADIELEKVLAVKINS